MTVEGAQPSLEALVLEPAGDVQQTVIWLHGLGADGHDFVPLVRQLTPRRPTRFIFPHAPERPVTVNGGLVMRAWYDIVDLGGAAPEDEAGIRASGAAVQALVDGEIERGIASDRIVLAGFSQGGAIALYAALRAPQSLAGVIGLSTYLPLAAALDSERSPASAGIAVFMAHGDLDPMIPVHGAVLSRDRLIEAGCRVEWHRYPMGHEVCGDEVRDIDAWLASTIP